MGHTDQNSTMELTADYQEHNTKYTLNLLCSSVKCYWREIIDFYSEPRKYGPAVPKHFSLRSAGYPTALQLHVKNCLYIATSNKLRCRDIYNISSSVVPFTCLRVISHLTLERIPLGVVCFYGRPALIPIVIISL